MSRISDDSRTPAVAPPQRLNGVHSQCNAMSSGSQQRREIINNGHYAAPGEYRGSHLPSSSSSSTAVGQSISSAQHQRGTDVKKNAPVAPRNYRLVIDPALKQGPVKVYRYDGKLPGETVSLTVRDPRSRTSRCWLKREPANLPVPNFKFDEHYVGSIPPKEVTLINVNDNINETFLRDMVKDFGEIEELTVHYHTKTKRHLGIATVIFCSPRAARLCVEKLNQASKMGKKMTVMIDVLGKERLRLIEEMTGDKPVLPSPVKTSVSSSRLHTPSSSTTSLALPVSLTPHSNITPTALTPQSTATPRIEHTSNATPTMNSYNNTPTMGHPVHNVDGYAGAGQYTDNAHIAHNSPATLGAIHFNQSSSALDNFKSPRNFGTRTSSAPMLDVSRVDHVAGASLPLVHNGAVAHLDVAYSHGSNHVDAASHSSGYVSSTFDDVVPQNAVMTHVDVLTPASSDLSHSSGYSGVADQCPNNPSFSWNHNEEHLTHSRRGGGDHHHPQTDELGRRSKSRDDYDNFEYDRTSEQSVVGRSQRREISRSSDVSNSRHNNKREDYDESSDKWREGQGREVFERSREGYDGVRDGYERGREGSERRWDGQERGAGSRHHRHAQRHGDDLDAPMPDDNYYRGNNSNKHRHSEHRIHRDRTCRQPGDNGSSSRRHDSEQHYRDSDNVTESRSNSNHGNRYYEAEEGYPDNRMQYRGRGGGGGDHYTADDRGRGRNHDSDDYGRRDDRGRGEDYVRGDDHGRGEDYVRGDDHCRGDYYVRGDDRSKGKDYVRGDDRGRREDYDEGESNGRRRRHGSERYSPSKETFVDLTSSPESIVDDDNNQEEEELEGEEQEVVPLSLESRIQALLMSAGEGNGPGFLSPATPPSTDDDTDQPVPPPVCETWAADPQPHARDRPSPPLPFESLPPLPPQDIPPLPPPGPPPPTPSTEPPVHVFDVSSGPTSIRGDLTLSDEVTGNGTPFLHPDESNDTLMTRSEVMADNDDDDDRMSLSSLSSGEEKLQVLDVTKAAAQSLPPPSWQPCIGAGMGWLPNGLRGFTTHDAGNGTIYSGYGGMDSSFCGGVGVRGGDHGMDEEESLSAEDEIEKKSFENALNEVVRELRAIMMKDVRKKMVELTGFKTFETWWQSNEALEKQLSSLPRLPSTFSTTAGSTALPPSSSSNFSLPVLIGLRSDQSSVGVRTGGGSSLGGGSGGAVGAGSSLSSLFFSSKQDSQLFGSFSFGHGGLLGLRGAIPKMPSFRKKIVPPSPARNDDDDEDEDEYGGQQVEKEEEEEEDGKKSTGSKESGDEDEEERDDDDDDDDSDRVSSPRSSVQEEEEGEEEEEEEEGGVKVSRGRYIDSDESNQSEIQEQEQEEEEEEEEADGSRERSIGSVRSEAEEDDEDYLSDHTEFGSETTQFEDDYSDVGVELTSLASDEEEEEEGVGSDVERGSGEEEDEEKDDMVVSERKKAEDEREEGVSTDGERGGARSVSYISFDDDHMSVSSRHNNDDDETGISTMTRKSKEREQRTSDSSQPIKPSGRRKRCSNSLSNGDISTDITTGVDISSSLAEAKRIKLDDTSERIVVIPIGESEGAKSRKRKRASRFDAMQNDDDRRCETPSTLETIAMDHPYTTELLSTSPCSKENISMTVAVSADSQAGTTVPDDIDELTETVAIKDKSVDNDLLTRLSADAVNKLAAVAKTMQPMVRLTDLSKPAIAAKPTVHLSNVTQQPTICLTDIAQATPRTSSIAQPSINLTEIIKPSALATAQQQNVIPAPADVTHSPAYITQPSPLFTDVTNRPVSRELSRLGATPGWAGFVPPPMFRFTQRDATQDWFVRYDYLIRGLDAEDSEYLRRRYEALLQLDIPQTYWLNSTHWVDHPTSFDADLPGGPANKKPRRKKSEEMISPHKTGCARTEGYQKLTHQEKRGYLRHARGVVPSTIADAGEFRPDLDPAANVKKKVQQSREARSESRRLQTVLSAMGEDYGELLKFNQLKFLQKQLTFARSSIHDWGLFALEHIAEGETVIEYVGQVVRQSIADIREKRYEARGIGSSYLFRVDSDTIVDATKYGNQARFINHCCNPNCCAKIVTVDSQKKIVIYSRRDIAVNEEITYDYKFPLEDEKIPCLCGALGCRGSLN